MYQPTRPVGNAFLRLDSPLGKTFGATSGGSDNKISRSSCLPHYSTLHRSFKPLLLDLLARIGQEYVEIVNSGARGAKFSSRSAYEDQH